MSGHVEERFRGPVLDRSRWLPHYLPAWSSRADTAASYAVEWDADEAVFTVAEISGWSA